MASFDIILVAVLIGSVLLTIGLLTWYLLRRRAHNHSEHHLDPEAMEDDLQHIEEEYKQELHQAGREEIEKAVSENAAFIQQDVRRATSELNGYMQQEVAHTLEDELQKYRQSAERINQIAIDSIAKSQATLEEQQNQLRQQLTEQVMSEKERLITRFEENMTDVISHYVTEAIGKQINVDDQLEYILNELKENKQAIIEDIRSGS